LIKEICSDLKNLLVQKLLHKAIKRRFVIDRANSANGIAETLCELLLAKEIIIKPKSRELVPKFGNH
jgi:hypothetical protein